MQEQKTEPSAYLPLHFKFTSGKLLSIAVVNTIISLFVIAIHPEIKFITSLIYSQCIGISIAGSVISTVIFIKTRRMGLEISLISVAVVVGAIIGVTLGIVTTRFLHLDVEAAMPPDMTFRFYLSNLLYALLFGSIVSYVFISLQKLSDEKIRRLEVEKYAIVMEIKLLQSQMEPHFLFNTLSTILSLIDDEPTKAKRMLESFTAFLRTSLAAGRIETTTLSKELDMIENYLKIYTVRMGDRLRYKIDIPDSLHDVHIPPLLVQPLVENAVKHGLEPSIRGGDLLIQGYREGDRVRIIVSDSGIGINESSMGNGISLENIRKRLDLLYQGRGRLFFEENKPSGVKVLIEIPYETV